MVDNNDLNFNTGGGQPSSSNKTVRMHVMPEDIFSEDELHRKINKLPPVKKAEVSKKVEVPQLPQKEEKPPAQKEEVVETIIPTGLKRPAKKKKMKPAVLAMVIVLLLLIFGGGGFAAWYYYDQSQQAALDRDLDLIQEQGDLKDDLADEEAKKAEEEAKKAEEEKKQRLIRDNQRLLDIISIQKALKTYYENNEKYPADLPSGEWTFDNVSYLETVPLDPLNEEDYVYSYDGMTGENYSITFMLEEGVNGLAAGIHSIMNTQLLTLNGDIQEVVIEDDTDLTQPRVLASSRDTDLDGVTDLEEFMYGTDPQLFDSDDDSYTDHQEILNLYAPSGMAPQTLLDVGLVNEYYSEKQNYKIYYPSAWRVQAIDVNDEEIMFVSDQTEEYMTVTVESNSGELSLSQWIKLRMSEVEIDYEAEYYQEDFVTRKGEMSGVWLPELFMIFFEKDNKVYSVAYHFDGLKQLSYKTTFEMMAKSFRFEEMSNLVEEETEEEEILVEGESTEGDVLDYEEENEIVEEEEAPAEETVESEFIENEIAEELIEEVETEEELMPEEMTEEGLVEEGSGELEEGLDEFYEEEPVEEIVEETEEATLEESVETDNLEGEEDVIYEY